MGPHLRPEGAAGELGARYLVAGSLQQAGTYLRLRVHLSDVPSGRVLWSDRHDVVMRESFAFEHDIAGMIAARLDVQITRHLTFER